MACTSASTWKRQGETCSLLSGSDQVWHTLLTSMMYPLVPQLSLWERVNNMFSYPSRSMPKGDKRFTVVILWPGEGWVYRGVPEFPKADLRLVIHQHLCPSVASFRAPTNNNGCLHKRLLAVTMRGLLCFGCPSGAT